MPLRPATGPDDVLHTLAWPDAAVTVHEERIVVAGGTDVQFPVRETAWGPILHTHADGSGDALRWVAQLPGAVRMDFADMARAADLLGMDRRQAEMFRDLQRGNFVAFDVELDERHRLDAQLLHQGIQRNGWPAARSAGECAGA